MAFVHLKYFFLCPISSALQFVCTYWPYCYPWQYSLCWIQLIFWTQTNEEYSYSWIYTRRSLEHAGLYKMPKTRVMLLGGATSTKAALLHSSFRNTINGFYIAIHQRPLSYTMRPKLKGNVNIRTDRGKWY